MPRPLRLSELVDARNAERIAASLAKYGYRGPGCAREVSRWLRARGEDIDTLVDRARGARREARPSQRAFRDTLLAAYGGRCAITGCDVPPALEAAHVADWHFENDAGAGILLRVDLHRLFEAGLLAIDGRYRVVETPLWYGELRGRNLRLPANRLHWPRLARVDGSGGSMCAGTGS